MKILYNNSKQSDSSLKKISQLKYELRFKASNVSKLLTASFYEESIDEEHVFTMQIKTNSLAAVEKVFLVHEKGYSNSYASYKNKLINTVINKGLKRKAHRHNQKFEDAFYSNFRHFNKDLSTKYGTYNIYYKFAWENPEIFFRINFVYSIVTSCLEPTFLLSTIRKKKRKNISKTIVIRYVKPKNRLAITLRLMNLFSKTFNFDKSHLNRSASLLSTLLEKNNSILFKKKIYTYNKLFLQKKVSK